jgi:hypothetical protein
MNHIQNIADESSDDEGFEVDETMNDGDDTIIEDVEDHEVSGVVFSSASSSSSSSSSNNYRSADVQSFPTELVETKQERDDEDSGGISRIPDSDVDTIDLFAQARKVPLSHQVEK